LALATEKSGSASADRPLYPGAGEHAAHSVGANVGPEGHRSWYSCIIARRRAKSRAKSRGVA
jgi:hypothetical protein